MTIDIENETQNEFDFEYKKVITDVINEAMDYVKCPYEAIVEVTITDNEGIRQINREQRGIDSPTDVLSFPMVEYKVPGDFSILEEDGGINCFDPDTGELMLGDIVISYDRVISQACEFGHSRLRELAFLVAHSMFHLFGYDHMEDEERKTMENMQNQVLCRLGITRDN